MSAPRPIAQVSTLQARLEEKQQEALAQAEAAKEAKQAAAAAKRAAIKEQKDAAKRIADASALVDLSSKHLAYLSASLFIIAASSKKAASIRLFGD